MTTTTETPSLTSRLAAVMGGIERIPKTGWNKEQGYAFVRESDIVDAIRGLLAEQGVALTASINDVQRWEITAARSGTKGTAILVDVTFTLASDGGEAVQSRWMGEATDYGDKALMKALTSAKKSWLLATFLISTGDDPEATPDVQHAPSERSTAFTPSEAQVKRLFAIAKNQDWGGVAASEAVKLACRILSRTKTAPTGEHDPNKIPSKDAYEAVAAFLEASTPEKITAMAKMQQRIDDALLKDAPRTVEDATRALLDSVPAEEPYDDTVPF